MAKHDFAGRETDFFCGVFDGHGAEGDKCSQFVRKQLPSLLAKEVGDARSAQDGGAGAASAETELGQEALEQVLTRVHRDLDRKMEEKKNIDDLVSGTTSVSLYLHGRKNQITISNVGDSRAVIGRTTGEDGGGKLAAFALSHDQTPYRLDERVRLRRAGARIRTGGQLAGVKPVDQDEVARDEQLLREGGPAGGLQLGEEIDEEGDPPRVFDPKGNWPGCAFSRSIGDGVGTRLGVIPDPEVHTVDLTARDKVLVLASDGVFEFLTNQTVVDMCARFEDPLEACRAVVVEAYKLWLQYEVRSDDITMICIFVDGVATPDLRVSTVGEMKEFATQMARPLRKGISMEKSKHILSQKSKMLTESQHSVEEEPESDFDVEMLYSDKTDEQKATIYECVMKCGICEQFETRTAAQREFIYKIMKPIEAKKGQWIMEQGHEGDCMYIVEEGTFEARVLGEGQKDEDGTKGVAVMVYEGSRERNLHPTFGDLALLYSRPRAASVVALEDGRLWSLHRYAYKKIMAEQSARKDAVLVLKGVDRFRALTPAQLTDLASYLIEVKYNPGDVVTKGGDIGDAMFILRPEAQCGECHAAMFASLCLPTRHDFALARVVLQNP